MKLPNKYLFLGLLGVFLFMIYPYMRDHRKFKDNQKIAPILLEDENEKVIVKGRTVTHIKRVHLSDGTTRQRVTRKTGVRKVATTVGEDGSVDVYALQYGPTFEPGISAGYGAGARVGLDAQLFYWKKWALGGGVDTDVRTTRHFRGHVGVFRDLYWPILDNTSLYFGIDHTTTLRLNFRVRFGGGS